MITYFFFGQFTSSFVKVDVGFFENNISVTPANTFDGSHGKHDFSVTVDIRAHDTKNVLILFRNDERLQ